MSMLHERPAHVARSRACHALGLSRTGTYPRQRPRRVSEGASPRQPRELTDEQRAQVLELVNSEAHQGVLGTVYRSALEEFGKPSPKFKTLDRSPERLDEIKRLLDDIRESGDPDEMPPEDFHEVWEAVFLRVDCHNSLSFVNNCRGCVTITPCQRKPIAY